MLRFEHFLSWVVCFSAVISLASYVDETMLELVHSTQNLHGSDFTHKEFEKEVYVDADVFGQTKEHDFGNFQDNSQSDESFSGSLLASSRAFNQSIFKNHTDEITNKSNLFSDKMPKIYGLLQSSKNFSAQDVTKNLQAANIELEMKEKIDIKSLTNHTSKRHYTPLPKYQKVVHGSQNNKDDLIDLTENKIKSELNTSVAFKTNHLQKNFDLKQKDSAHVKHDELLSTISNNQQALKVDKIRVESFTEKNSKTNFKNTNKSAKISRWTLNNWYSVLMIACIGISILLFLQSASYIGSILNEELQKTLDWISRDAIVIAILVIIGGILHYFKLILFLEYYVNFEVVRLGIMLFGIFWIILGLFLTIIANFYIREWRAFESEYQKRDAIFRGYEDIYYNSQRSEELNAELKYRRRQLEYFLMRQEFVTPSLLPIFGEDFSRDDFNFSAYLTKCFCKANQNAFRFDFLTLLIIAITTGLSALVYHYIQHLLIKILIVSPVLLYIALRLLARKMTRIYGQLVTIVKSPYDVDLAKFENLRQPQINLEKLSIPAYLSRRFPLNQLKESWYDMTQPNRHLLLYWLHSPGFIVRILHSILVIHLEWIVYFIIDLSFGIEKFESYYYWIGVGIAILFSLVNLFYTLPQILKLSAITNNIQMLKDRKIRRKVCEEGIERRQKTMQNIYSVLKTIRRQSLNIAKDYYLRLYIVGHVREVFKELRGPENDKTITCTRLLSLAHLCGRDLTEREAMILAHDITCKNPSNISFDEFMESIEKISVDVSSNPYEISKAVIKNLTNTVSSTISSKNLRNSLEKLDLLGDQDINVLLHEVKYLPIEHAQHSLSIIATLIRDSIEGMPR